MLKVAGSIPDSGCTYLYYARGAQGGTAHEGGGTTSQLGLPPLTPLAIVGGCVRLQLGVPLLLLQLQLITASS